MSESVLLLLGLFFPDVGQPPLVVFLPQGLVRLKLYQDLIGDFPTVAIGGIDLSRADEVWQCGVSSLAVVRAITLSSDPKSVIAEFNQVMNQKRPSDAS